MEVELPRQQLTTVDLEDNDRQPMLSTNENTEASTSRRRRCRCTSRDSVWYPAGGLALFLVASFILLASLIRNHRDPPRILPPDEYTVALKKALLFFDAQMSGVLPSSHRIPWRGNSATKDGRLSTPRGLVGGYYDAGDNTKTTFLMAHSVALLSWSAIEYKHKYIAIREYDHVRDIIRWGLDYFLRSFDCTSGGSVTEIYTRVGNANDDTHDGICWERPEVIDYIRQPTISHSAPDIAAEMAAALAVGSMVFNDDRDYSLKLVEAAVSLFYFAVDSGRRPSPITEDQRHQSSGFHDEHIWASSFLYFATGNSSFLSFATDEQIAKKAGVFGRSRDSRVLSWDRKLPGAALLLRRLRVFINPGYPAEDMLRLYHGVSGDNACSYLRQFGGMIVLNNGTHGHLQHVVNAVFTATLFADYLRAEKVPGWYCGPNFIGVEDLDQFARSQVIFEYLYYLING
ncbi:hypothetical protein MKW94_015167 [Papaver nudicaule]|uniref:cellulase n=1 Tax=Papaver nudicaule TaxID=74823 RepID=A0AA41VYW1_PAPNU|nr:hypothetical protein [Papaver nudicaule]